MAKKKVAKKPSKKASGKVVLGSQYQVTISSLSFKDQEVHTFLADKDNKEEWAIKALVIGSIGLKNMLVGYNIDYVDKRFKEFMDKADKKFESERDEIQSKIDEIFNLENKNSAVSIFYKKIDDTFNEDDKKSPMGKLVNHLETYFDDKKGVVRRIIKDTFNLKDESSPMGMLKTDLDHYFNKEDGVVKKIIDSTFDVDKADTPLYRLTQNIDYYFDEKNGVLKRLLDDTFNIEKKQSVMSKFVKLLEDNFDVDKGSIKKLLDPNINNSPINKLKTELLSDITTIKEAIIKEEAKKEITQKTPLKGGEFEDEVSDQLDSITSPYRDEFKNVSSVVGRTGKAGDFVVLINGEESSKIVIEAKDRTYSKPEVLKILEDSMKNRNAKFGIFLFKYQNQIPSTFRPLKIMKNSIIASADNYGLYFAYRIAKLFIEKELEKGEEEIPIDKIEGEIRDLLEQCNIIDMVLSKAKSISSASDYIHQKLTILHTQIETALAKIEGDIKV